MVDQLFQFSKAEDRHVLSRWCLYEIRISDHATFFSVPANCLFCEDSCYAYTHAHSYTYILYIYKYIHTHTHTNTYIHTFLHIHIYICTSTAGLVITAFVPAKTPWINLRTASSLLVHLRSAENYLPTHTCTQISIYIYFWKRGREGDGKRESERERGREGNGRGGGGLTRVYIGWIS